MFEKIECPWCHEMVFAPINDEKKMRTTNDISIIYKETTCPSCEKRITLIDDVHIKVMSPTVVRLEDEDKVVPMFAEYGSKYHESILAVRKELDEALGKLRDEWDNPEPEDEKIKIVVIASDGSELESTEEVTQYIRENYDCSDLEDWIDTNFDEVEIGPYDWRPSEIIDNMGSFSDIAECELYSCNYAQERYENSDMVEFENLDSPNDVDTPKNGETVEVAGLSFKYEWRKKDGSKI